ncbi:adenosylcobinamide-GDP ribazoletransferase [Streptomyces sp. NPDC090106]|uniref:adenosylcobinamide-GDP ribazoletransferase n=1 Tax=Streptomyces sp. NPDC090106 TaxID=3365946 RepID=UPI00381DE05F
MTPPPSKTPPPSPSPHPSGTPAPEPALPGLRFAFGTLSVIPVKVSRWDREAARGGMLCAPLVGAVLGALAAGAGLLALLLGTGALLAAVASVAVPAALTRGLHLDGLADTADGLGSAKPAADALRIMKQSDIGPFGVLTLVFALLAQVAALARAYDGSWARGAVAAVVAGCAARLAMTCAARAGVAAARPEGLGAVVAGVVPAGGAVAVGGGVLLAAGGLGVLLGSWAPVVAVVVAAVVAELWLRHCVRRFGGVTGDVFGAVEEVALTAALVVFASAL